jgi:hypothetical protein
MCDSFGPQAGVDVNHVYRRLPSLTRFTQVIKVDLFFCCLCQGAANGLLRHAVHLHPAHMYVCATNSSHLPQARILTATLELRQHDRPTCMHLAWTRCAMEDADRLQNTVPFFERWCPENHLRLRISALCGPSVHCVISERANCA